MTMVVSSDIIAAIAEKTNTSFEKMIEYLQAQILGFINPKYVFNLAAKANVIIWKFPTPDQRYVPKLESSLMRVDVSVAFSSTAPKMIIRTYNGNETYDEKVLGGDSFTTLVSRSFDKQMQRGEKYNILFDQDCTIKYLKIIEIPANS